MNKKSLAAAAICAAVVIAAAPAKDPPPIANYWMDVATTSGFGPGMSAAQMMMGGGGNSLGHTIDLRLASKTAAPAAPKADHWIPGGLQMGPSLPLVTPAVAKQEPVQTGMPMNYKPKGRVLIYWGCGEHVSAGQPTVIDFAKLAPGKAPQGMASIASMAKVVSGPHSAPGFGHWPNERDSRAVPAAGSLLGAHKVAGNYSPDIGFSLASGQDFMPGLGFREGGTSPSGAARLNWQPVAQATGYALMMFGSNEAGDTVMWSSAKTATMATMDYVAPSEVKRLINAGAVLPPSANECLLPAEVAAAVPAGMVMMIGYGPEVNFAQAPKAPKWTAKVRYKTTASLMRGMAGMMGDAGGDESTPSEPQTQQQPKKKKKFGLGDLIGAVPRP
jgi:hypothetical protein